MSVIDEIAAERAAAAEAMREACLDAAEAERQDWLQITPAAPVALGCAHVKRRIRALPIPDASALAERDERMREEGRREGMEQAAQIAQDRESEGGEYGLAARHIAAAIRAAAKGSLP